MGEEKETKPSADYIKAYNQADMICTYMPHLLEGMQAQENEPSEYTRGFTDRVRQYEIEQDILKNFSLQDLKQKYGKDMDEFGKNPNMDIDKD